MFIVCCASVVSNKYYIHTYVHIQNILACTPYFGQVVSRPRYTYKAAESHRMRRGRDDMAVTTLSWRLYNGHTMLNSHHRRDETGQYCRVGDGSVNWA